EDFTGVQRDVRARAWFSAADCGEKLGQSFRRNSDGGDDAGASGNVRRGAEDRSRRARSGPAEKNHGRHRRNAGDARGGRVGGGESISSLIVWWRGSAPPRRGRAPSPHEHVLGSRLPPSARQQRQFPPFPVTIHIGESDFAQPLQLGLDIEKLV